MLELTREESPQQKLRKLEGWLVQYGFSLPTAVPLFASLLSLPLGAGYTPLPVTPAQHKHQTLQAILTALLKRAAQQPILFVMEDCTGLTPRHWSCWHPGSRCRRRDPALLTFRPESRRRGAPVPMWRR